MYVQSDTSDNKYDSLRPFLLIFIITVPVESVHEKDIGKDECDKDIHRPLLGHPESKRESSQLQAIKLGFPKDTATISHEKPNGKEYAEIEEVSLPVC